MRRFAGLVLLAVLPACGGNKITDIPPVTPPLVPAATVTATGNGTLVLHPSLNPTFAVAMETPIRVTETGGGTADWNFARLQLIRGGLEIERLELTATTINAAGFGRISANSNQSLVLTYRFNSTDFDRVDLTLGFTDRRDNRQFNVSVPFGSFAGVSVSPTPLSHRPPVALDPH